MNQPPSRVQVFPSSLQHGSHLDAGSAQCETPSMRDPSSTVVFRWLAAGDAGDLNAFDELLHPDAIIHAPAGLSTTSADEEKAVWRDALAAMPDLRHEVQEVLVDGAVEMARVVVTGTLTATFGGIEGTGRLPDRSGGDHPPPRWQGGRGVGRLLTSPPSGRSWPSPDTHAAVGVVGLRHGVRDDGFRTGFATIHRTAGQLTTR